MKLNFERRGRDSYLGDEANMIKAIETDSFTLPPRLIPMAKTGEFNLALCQADEHA
jgi:hypothetical protein